MKTTKTPVWRASTDEVRVETMKDALVSADGNISEAAGLLNVDRSHVTKLVKRFELAEYAAQLRLKAGRGRRGRPPG